jgi:hypothetical protein
MQLWINTFVYELRHRLDLNNEDYLRLQGQIPLTKQLITTTDLQDDSVLHVTSQLKNAGSVARYRDIMLKHAFG